MQPPFQNLRGDEDGVEKPEIHRSCVLGQCERQQSVKTNIDANMHCSFELCVKIPRYEPQPANCPKIEKTFTEPQRRNSGESVHHHHKQYSFGRMQQKINTLSYCKVCLSNELQQTEHRAELNNHLDGILQQVGSIPHNIHI